MRPSLLVLAPLVATTTAHGLTQLEALHLLKRQSSGNGAFIPGTTTVSDCPEGSILCGTSNTCYFPSRGDTCCPGGTWACPGDSFCLQDPYCCPTGLDRETCAQQYGVTLTPTVSSAADVPDTTIAQPTSAPSAPSSSSTSVDETRSSSSSSSSSTSVPVIPTTTSTTSAGAPSSVPTSTPVVSSTATATATPSTGLFTGGAIHAREIAAGGILLGGLGAVANIL
ncbi:hypothetical protein ASPACDRAFT_127499 [Aspergillus aculeatus ATCC 16872]|uniref:Granulins domain-containing protein n=1 Tax=Aspergillus aculeatus (strain ATCC 16872 / CBS 172.66 / WB 5094) TaxID=690307 RepID=A0A1L9WFT0_ASPA1|nr:uncharacterized protein ASPACDRAFT_127499 [Aspergillus aculeatus ATCC 16872]OJJ95024.1 hypothetical protein ASPACDRAFT_127499 [Aspergillus aculeatus ATCC 16872]